MIEIEILTESKEIATICGWYWEIDSNLEFVHKVTEIAELAKIDKTKLPSLVKDSCRAYVPDWKCDDCGNPYVFASRSDFLGKRKYMDGSSSVQYTFVCDECQRKRRQKELEEKQRQEEAARKAREAAEKELRKRIQETFDLSKRQPIDVGKLSLKEITFLISVIRGGAYENLTKIMPLAMFDRPLTPSQSYTKEIIDHLYTNHLLYIHPDTEPESFPAGDTDTFYTWHVYYSPPISLATPDDPTAIMRELMARINSNWPDEWYQEAYDLWGRVALEESKEYLLFVLNEHHFDFSPGEKTTQYLEYALQYFSTAQVFNTIWRAAKDAAAYYQREDNISKRQAANSAIASIQRITERVVAEGWDIKPFGRNFKCPQSVISEVLYNAVLRLGDEGFQLSPNIDLVKQRTSRETQTSI